MSTQIQFRQGEYIKFTAARDFSLGGVGISIQSGMELLFDGTNVIYNGGPPTNMFQLRGACKAGWLIPTENYDPEDTSASMPKSAGIRVRNAVGGNPMDVQTRTIVTTAAAEEQEVGHVASHSQQTRTRNANHHFQGTVQRGAMIVDEQEGIPVRTVSTPAKQDANLELESAGEILRRARNVQIQPGVGKTRDEVLAEMSAEDREEYLARIEAGRASKPGGDRDANGNSIVGSVAAPKTIESGGFTINNSVGRGSTPVADLSGTTGQTDVQVIEVDGIKLTNTNGPRREAIRPATRPAAPRDADPRRTIARSICADFPDNYNFNDPVRKKIARLQADFDDRPDVIRAVAAAETDGEVKSRLVTEFPDAFTG